jgi:hypothetical protein
MSRATIRDRFWLWGMKVNALQETSDFAALRFGTSTLTVDEAMRRTGVTNVIVAGGLPLSEDTLAALPLAKRLLCKWSLHRHDAAGAVIDYEDCLARLMDAKRLAAVDTRIDGFHLDDFSTGSLSAGARPEHVQRLLYANAVSGPRVPLSTTIYHMSLEIPELPSFLPYFDQYLLPLWHADQIEALPSFVDRLGELSGRKPILLCLYVYDFGAGRHLPGELMRRHLEVAENLMLEQRVTGLCVCGTCMMDLDWEANHVLFDWLERSGGKAIG